MKSLLVLACALSATLPSLGQVAFEFSAHLKTVSAEQFVVTDLDTRNSSGWLELGQNFEGYAIVAYDPTVESLTLRKGDDVVHVPLKTAVVKTAQPTAPDLATRIAAAKAQLAELRQRYLEKHPRMVELTRRIAEMERQAQNPPPAGAP